MFSQEEQSTQMVTPSGNILISMMRRQTVNMSSFPQPYLMYPSFNPNSIYFPPLEQVRAAQEQSELMRRQYNQNLSCTANHNSHSMRNNSTSFVNDQRNLNENNNLPNSLNNLRYPHPQSQILPTPNYPNSSNSTFAPSETRELHRQTFSSNVMPVGSRKQRNINTSSDPVLSLQRKRSTGIITLSDNESDNRMRHNNASRQQQLSNPNELSERSQQSTSSIDSLLTVVTDLETDTRESLKIESEAEEDDLYGSHSSCSEDCDLDDEQKMIRNEIQDSSSVSSVGSPSESVEIPTTPTSIGEMDQMSLEENMEFEPSCSSPIEYVPGRRRKLRMRKQRKIPKYDEKLGRNCDSESDSSPEDFSRNCSFTFSGSPVSSDSEELEVEAKSKKHFSNHRISKLVKDEHFKPRLSQNVEDFVSEEDEANQCGNILKKDESLSLSNNSMSYCEPTRDKVAIHVASLENETRDSIDFIGFCSAGQKKPKLQKERSLESKRNCKSESDSGSDVSTRDCNSRSSKRSVSSDSKELEVEAKSKKHSSNHRISKLVKDEHFKAELSQNVEDYVSEEDEANQCGNILKKQESSSSSNNLMSSRKPTRNKVAIHAVSLENETLDSIDFIGFHSAGYNKPKLQKERSLASKRNCKSESDSGSDVSTRHCNSRSSKKSVCSDSEELEVEAKSEIHSSKHRISKLVKDEHFKPGLSQNVEDYVSVEDEANHSGNILKEVVSEEALIHTYSKESLSFPKNLMSSRKPTRNKVAIQVATLENETLDSIDFIGFHSAGQKKPKLQKERSLASERNCKSESDSGSDVSTRDCNSRSSKRSVSSDSEELEVEAKSKKHSSNHRISKLVKDEHFKPGLSQNVEDYVSEEDEANHSGNILKEVVSEEALIHTYSKESLSFPKNLMSSRKPTRNKVAIHVATLENESLDFIDFIGFHSAGYNKPKLQKERSLASKRNCKSESDSGSDVSTRDCNSRSSERSVSSDSEELEVKAKSKKHSSNHRISDLVKDKNSKTRLARDIEDDVSNQEEANSSGNILKKQVSTRDKVSVLVSISLNESFNCIDPTSKIKDCNSIISKRPSSSESEKSDEEFALTSTRNEISMEKETINLSTDTKESISDTAVTTDKEESFGSTKNSPVSDSLSIWKIGSDVDFSSLCTSFNNKKVTRADETSLMDRLNGNANDRKRCVKPKIISDLKCVTRPYKIIKALKNDKQFVVDNETSNTRHTDVKGSMSSQAVGEPFLMYRDDPESVDSDFAEEVPLTCYQDTCNHGPFGCSVIWRSVFTTFKCPQSGYTIIDEPFRRLTLCENANASENNKKGKGFQCFAPKLISADVHCEREGEMHMTRVSNESNRKMGNIDMTVQKVTSSVKPSEQKLSTKMENCSKEEINAEPELKENLDDMTQYKNENASKSIGKIRKSIQCTASKLPSKGVHCEREKETHMIRVSNESNRKMENIDITVQKVTSTVKPTAQKLSTKMENCSKEEINAEPKLQESLDDMTQYKNEIASKTIGKKRKRIQCTASKLPSTPVHCGREKETHITRVSNENNRMMENIDMPLEQVIGTLSSSQQKRTSKTDNFTNEKSSTKPENMVIARDDETHINKDSTTRKDNESNQSMEDVNMTIQEVIGTVPKPKQKLTSKIENPSNKKRNGSPENMIIDQPLLNTKTRKNGSNSKSTGKGRRNYTSPSQLKDKLASITPNSDRERKIYMTRASTSRGAHNVHKTTGNNDMPVQQTKTSLSSLEQKGITSIERSLPNASSRKNRNNSKSAQNRSTTKTQRAQTPKSKNMKVQQIPETVPRPERKQISKTEKRKSKNSKTLGLIVNEISKSPSRKRTRSQTLKTKKMEGTASASSVDQRAPVVPTETDDVEVMHEKIMVPVHKKILESDGKEFLRKFRLPREQVLSDKLEADRKKYPCKIILSRTHFTLSSKDTRGDEIRNLMRKSNMLSEEKGQQGKKRGRPKKTKN